MRRIRLLRALVIATTVVVSVALFSSCRRAPEDPGEFSTITAPEEELQSLALPQQNSAIGITLAALPSGLVVTYNGEHWIELTDERRHSLRYTFIETVPDSPGISPTSVSEFEAMIREYPDGEVLDSGSVDTARGKADWSNGSYGEDGEILEHMLLFSPHPSGSGILILRSISPIGLATLDERLSVMMTLLTHVS